MPTYLVTGAAGFIASKVCECLLADGHSVVGIDNLNDYYDVRLKDYRLARLLNQAGWSPGSNPGESQFQGRKLSHGRFVFRPIDIENRSELDALFSEFRFDAVFNLAARAGVRASMENPHIFLSTNTQGALNILEAMKKHGVGKHVLASTSSLYAGCPMPWQEMQPVNTPLSPYAATKKAAELMAYSYYKLYGLDTTVVRYFTVFGPAGRPDMSIFRFVKWIDSGETVEVFGDGAQSRDFTYVDDIARGTILAAQPLGFEIVNLGGGRAPVSLMEVIAWIEERLEKKAAIVRLPFHAADILESCADISKAQRLLAWEPKVTVRAGLDRTISWYLENKHWLSEIHTSN